MKNSKQNDEDQIPDITTAPISPVSPSNSSFRATVRSGGPPNYAFTSTTVTLQRACTSTQQQQHHAMLIPKISQLSIRRQRQQSVTLKSQQAHNPVPLSFQVSRPATAYLKSVHTTMLNTQALKNRSVKQAKTQSARHRSKLNTNLRNLQDSATTMAPLSCKVEPPILSGFDQSKTISISRQTVMNNEFVFKKPQTTLLGNMGAVIRQTLSKVTKKQAQPAASSQLDYSNNVSVMRHQVRTQQEV